MGNTLSMSHPRLFHLAPHLTASDNKFGRGANQTHASYYVILSVAKDLLADHTLSTVILSTLSVILSTLSVILNTLSVILSVAKDLEVCATIHRL